MKLVSKGMWMLAALCVLAVSCAKEQLQKPEAAEQTPDITAYTGADTRASVVTAEDGTHAIVWNPGDSISVFNLSEANQLYVLRGEGGTTHGTFAYKSGFSLGYPLSSVYCIYPYDRMNAADEDFLYVQIPGKQEFTPGSFDPKANVMVGAALPGNDIAFKNVGGYLLLQLYGENAKVKSISVKSNGGERLVGPAMVSINPGADPVIVEEQMVIKPIEVLLRGSVEKVPMSIFGSNTVTLTAQDSVAVGATAAEATTFWFVVLPQELEEGFTVKVNWTAGIQTQTLESPITFERSTICRMEAFELDPEKSDNTLIQFKDDRVRAFLVEQDVDTDGDDEISMDEAAAVTSLEGIFYTNTYEQYTTYDFTSFDELQYFTGITELPAYLFYKSTALQSVTMPASLKKIGSCAFSGCSGLTSVTLNPGLEVIGVSAFNGTSLTAVSLPSTLTVLDAASLQGTAIEELVIPGGVEIIGSAAFYACHALKKVTVQEGVKKIYSQAFYNCENLISVDLPASLTEVQYSVFGCWPGTPALASVTFHGTTPPSLGMATMGSSTVKIYVPASAVDAYKSATGGWTMYKDQVYPIE